MTGLLIGVAFDGIEAGFRFGGRMVLNRGYADFWRYCANC